MNNFNEIEPTGNHMTSGNPADEYNNRARYEEEHCAECGEEVDGDILYKNDGLCNECFIRNAGRTI